MLVSVCLFWLSVFTCPFDLLAAGAGAGAAVEGKEGLMQSIALLMF